jgi:phenylacetate-CoA ligase
MQPAPDAYALALQFQFDASEWWTAQRIETEQMRQAQALLQHAARTVPFYRERLAGMETPPAGGLDMARFRQLPLMTREDIQRAGASLISRELPPAHGQMHIVRTSGSTGRPIEVRGTRMTQLMMMALTMRGHRWHRRDLTQKNVDIRTALAKGVTAPPRWAPTVDGGPTVLLDIANPISTLFEQVLSENPAYLQAHPYTVKALVEMSIEHDRRPPQLREVRTFGEAVPRDLPALLQQHWQVPLVDVYSATEIGMIAHQCPETGALHVQAENVVVEVLADDGQPCAAGESGRLVVTPLHNFATPLIRYEIGDIVRVGSPCRCGRGLAVLEQVLGRERNLLVYPNGDRVFPEPAVGGLEKIAPIRQFQMIQTQVDRLQFNVVAGAPWTAQQESALRAFMHAKFGYPFAIDIVYLDEIPRMANGKFETFRSDVAVPPRPQP